MKVNFNQTFKNYRGEDLLIGGEAQHMNVIVAQALFNGDNIKPSGDPLKDGVKKVKAYSLCMRLVEATEPITLKSDEIEIIKEAIGSLTPGCYGQVIQLLDE